LGKFDDSSAKLIDAFLHRRSNLELYYDIRQTNVQVIFWIFLLWHSPVWDANKESDRIYIVYSINLLAIAIHLFHYVKCTLWYGISWTEGPDSGRSASSNDWCCKPFLISVCATLWVRICMVDTVLIKDVGDGWYSRTSDSKLTVKMGHARRFTNLPFI